MFEKYKIRNLISLSPHCYNTLKNEYHASNINNMHYTQVIAEKVDQGKLKPSKRIEKKVAFHDPCYLGRYNNMYEQPRKILEAIPGVKLVEMYRNKRHSFCCGGGSGRVLTEDLPYLERPSMERLKEAVEVGADVIATACPLCLIMLTDATKSFGLEEKINVKDIIELVVEAL
jgi:Fe-S oxidoreductase